MQQLSLNDGPAGIVGPRPKPPLVIASAIAHPGWIWSEALNRWIGYGEAKVTPAIAQKICDMKDANYRNKRDHRVFYYARMMANIKWLLTPQGIIFFDNGQRGDGDHRLHAVVDSGRTVAFMVTWGWPTNIQPVLDEVLPRAPIDYLRQILGVGWSNTQIGAVKVLSLVAFSTGSNKLWPKETIAECAMELQNAIDKATSWLGQARRNGIMREEVIAVIAAATYRHADIKLRKFCDGLSSGLGMTPGSAEETAILARNELLSMKGRYKIEDRKRLVGKLYNAIEKFMANTPVKLLKELDWRLALILPARVRQSLASCLTTMEMPAEESDSGDGAAEEPAMNLATG